MRLVLSLALLALATSAGAQTKPAPKPAAPKAAPKIAFDARDPQALVDLLATMQAKAEVRPRTDASVSLDVTTPGGGFGAQFVDCDAAGKGCQGIAFSTAFERKGVTLTHLNIFNRSQIACRGYLTDDNRPNVMYSAMLTSRLSADEMKQHVGVWQGCLALFNTFTADPVRYIAGR